MFSSVQSSTATVHQLDAYRKPYDPPPLAPDLPKPPAKKHNRLAWLKTVKVDPTLRPSAFKTAFEVTQYVNVETGEFWAAAKTIAEGGEHSYGIAMSEATVIEDLRRLVSAGHLELIRRGRPGRGSSNHYRLLVKPQPAEVSVPDKTSGSDPENLRIGQIKPQPAEENHIGNHRSNHGAATPRAHVDTSVPVAETTEADRAFGTLCRFYTKAPDIGCREVFDQLLDAGVDLDDILDAAADYIGRCHDAGKEPKPMIQFLQSHHRTEH